MRRHHTVMGGGRPSTASRTASALRRHRFCARRSRIWSRRSEASMSALVLLTSVLIGGDASHLAKIRPAPDFTLKTQDGKELRLSELRGKVLLVSFVFTTCNGSCPPTTSRL